MAWWINEARIVWRELSFTHRGFALCLLISIVSWACTPAQLATTDRLLGAANLLQNMAQRASEAADEQDRASALEVAPEVMAQLRVALVELCTSEPPILPPEHKVCRHFRAYEADPSP